LAAPRTARRPIRSAAGANTFDIEFVNIGNPGNAADTTGNPNPTGSVPYTYRMDTYEISDVNGA
jgi:formylglycine-generating enzyme